MSPSDVFHVMFRPFHPAIFSSLFVWWASSCSGTWKASIVSTVLLMTHTSIIRQQAGGDTRNTSFYLLPVCRSSRTFSSWCFLLNGTWKRAVLYLNTEVFGVNQNLFLVVLLGNWSTSAGKTKRTICLRVQSILHLSHLYVQIKHKPNIVF